MAMLKVYLLICSLTIEILNSGHVQAYLSLKNHQPPSDQANRLLHLVDSKPLILTPLIEANQIDEAKILSKVEFSNLNLKSYSGFLTVDKKYDSNMFFWFFPALSGKVDVPILLWLQGGPGGSSLYGLFTENGPLVINSENYPSLRNYTWNDEFALLYIDNPVGAGFSFTKHDDGYARNETDVAENLYKALEQFFRLFHEYQKNEFFLSGESYAGKFIPAIAYKIHEMNKHKTDSKRINLQGLAIGDGFCDPLNMMDYGQYLYQIGLIDERQQEYMMKKQQEVASLIRKKEFSKAQKLFNELFDYFRGSCGHISQYNYLRQDSPNADSYEHYLALPGVRKRIHVGDLPFNSFSQLVHDYLDNDFMDGVKPWIEELLDADYRILFYSGQLDIIVAAPLTENLLLNLNWKGENQYKSTERIIYKVDDLDQQVAGYVRQANNLYYAMIRNGGHMLPHDQPRVAQDMIKRFVRKESYKNIRIDQNFLSDMKSV